MSAAGAQLGAALLSGALFAVGLVVSGMVQPEKVIGFLDVGGAWDPSLAWVMGAAVAVHALAVAWSRRRSSPLFAERFALPTRRDLDPPLIAGAALFGVGWGLGGLCPGPALIASVAAAPSAGVFVLAMISGMALVAHAPRLRPTERGAPR